MGKIGDKRAIKPLIAALKERLYYDMRSKAAQALGKLHDPRAVEPLIAALKDGDDDVRHEAANALEALGMIDEAKQGQLEWGQEMKRKLEEPKTQQQPVWTGESKCAHENRNYWSIGTCSSCGGTKLRNRCSDCGHEWESHICN